MKLSAHVPDELWARAVALHPGLGPSGVVQQALRRLVERPRPRFAPRVPEDQLPTVRRRHLRLQGLAQAAYDDGYEAGLRLCEKLRWADLERLAAAGWRLPAAGPETEGPAATSAYRSGLEDALREVWLSVVQAGAGGGAVDPS